MSEEKDWTARFELAQKRTRGPRTLLAIGVLLVAALFLFRGGSGEEDADTSSAQRGPLYIPVVIGSVSFAGWLAISDWTRQNREIPPEESTNI
jgi:hypothetical protein